MRSEAGVGPGGGSAAGPHVHNVGIGPWTTAPAGRPVDDLRLLAAVGGEAASVVDPLIAVLNSRAHAVADAELARLRSRLPGLAERERVEAAAAVHRIVGGLLDTPAVRVRLLAGEPDGLRYVDALTRLFDLDAGEPAS